MSKATEPQQTPYLLPQGAYPVYMPKADDEIDLFELMATLWKKKGIILLVTFLTTALAAGYAFTAKEQWTAKTIVTVPTIKSIEELYENDFLLPQLNSFEVRTKEPNVDEKFQRGINNFRQALMNSFIIDVLAKGIKATPIYVDDKNIVNDRPIAFNISISAGSADDVVKLLNTQLKLSSDAVIDRVYQDQKSQFEIYRKELSSQLTHEREVSEAKKQSKIKSTEEALLNVKALVTKEGGRDAIENRHFTEAESKLSAELTLLKSQSLTFSEKYYEIQSELSHLKFNEPKHALAFSYLNSPSESVTKDKSKKTLILVLGALLGGMLGGTTVLVFYLIKQRKQKLTSPH